MLLAVDVQYTVQSSAVAAGVLFDGWSASAPVREVHTRVRDVHDYIPGQFYRRELPCILALLDELETLPKTVVIDGFVTLGSGGRPGLGYHLFHALDEAVPVIGVAKKPFKETPRATEVYRGKSAKPLFVTSIGTELEYAKAAVKAMPGAHRLPVMLKRVDRLCRDLLEACQKDARI